MHSKNIDSVLNPNRVKQYQCLDIQYTLAELSRIDLILRREVRRWVEAGQDPNDDFRGLYVTQFESEKLLTRPIGVSWGQTISLSPKEKDKYTQELDEVNRSIDRLASDMLSQSQAPRLLHIAEKFGLDRVALDILLLCIAPAFDTRYERIYGYLQDNVNRRQPMVRLVIDLLGNPGIEQFSLFSYFAAESPLFRYKLLQQIPEHSPSSPGWIYQTLNPDQTLVAWLLGHYEPQGFLQGHAQLISPDTVIINECVLDSIRANLDKVHAQYNNSVQGILVLYGEDKLVQQAAGQWLALQLKRPLLLVDLNKIVSESYSPNDAVSCILRDALFSGAITMIDGWDKCLDIDSTPTPSVLEQIYAHPEPLILAGTKRWQPQHLLLASPLLWIECPVPSYGQRQTLWSHFVAQTVEYLATIPSTNSIPKQAERNLNIPDLAGQFALNSSQIRAAAAAAIHRAYLEQRAVGETDLFEAARAYSNPRLSSLARKIEPRYKWSDIVIPQEQLRILQELVSTVRQRPKVLEDWGLGEKLASSAGVTVLFGGPPGTGKTMAAEVIAGELKLDLYKIDLSSMVSKYIGETEKNLEKIFNEASTSNAILFFDEADAIFGKRSEVKDAHDRYANIEVSYLLQRMEAYEGVTILATNLKANLDEAFARRLQFAVDFPLPEYEERLHIWETLFPDDAPREKDLDFSLLARRFDLAGGNIRNIIIAAAYLAANQGKPISMAHLMHGARRELQKMGRLLGEKDFAI